jgi:hypothetical protein
MIVGADQRGAAEPAARATAGEPAAHLVPAAT